jgi:aspartate/methionine/tyrosine aminotransferase
MLDAKKPLPEDWIDLGIGDARIVREALLESFPDLQAREVFRDRWLSQEVQSLGYLQPEGIPGLRISLRKLHELQFGEVCVTAGAKAALLAVLVAAKGMGRKAVTAYVPYWSSFPRLAEIAGLHFFPFAPLAKEAQPFKPGETVMIVTDPNNPDGRNTYDSVYETIREMGYMLVHDAAYWSPIYGIDKSRKLPSADVHVFSCSKAMGLSGARVGYTIAWPEMHREIVEAVEATTSGASEYAQQVVWDAVNLQTSRPEQWASFVNDAKSKIDMNRKAFLENLPNGVASTGSMYAADDQQGIFLWLEKGPEYGVDRVRVVDGKDFGRPGWFRINLGNYGLKETIDIAKKRMGKSRSGAEPSWKDPKSKDWSSIGKALSGLRKFRGGSKSRQKSKR